jgi:hypothetical protein
MAVDITRSQNSRWEVRMIRRIGKMLGFQAERGVLREYMPVASGHGSIERVAGVQMDAGLCGQDIEHATADRIDQARCGAQFAGNSIDHPGVIIPAKPIADLFIVGTEAGANRHRRGEVHDGTAHGADFAGWNERRVDRKEETGKQLQLVMENITCTSQIEVRMVRQIDNRCTIGCRTVSMRNALSPVKV